MIFLEEFSFLINSAAKLGAALGKFFPLGRGCCWRCSGAQDMLPSLLAHISLLNFTSNLSAESYRSGDQLLSYLNNQLNIINSNALKLHEVQPPHSHFIFLGLVQDISLQSLQFFGTQLTTSNLCFLLCILNDILVNTISSYRD